MKAKFKYIVIDWKRLKGLYVDLVRILKNDHFGRKKVEKQDRMTTGSPNWL